MNKQLYNFYTIKFGQLKRSARKIPAKFRFSHEVNPGESINFHSPLNNQKTNLMISGESRISLISLNTVNVMREIWRQSFTTLI